MNRLYQDYLQPSLWVALQSTPSDMGLIGKSWVQSIDRGETLANEDLGRVTTQWVGPGEQ